MSTEEILNADDMMFVQESCTCLGLDVVPDVCKIKQKSSPLFSSTEHIEERGTCLIKSSVFGVTLSMQNSFISSCFAASIRAFEALLSVIINSQSRSSKKNKNSSLV